MIGRTSITQNLALGQRAAIPVARSIQYLNAGLIDEFTIAQAPVIFGGGVRLFEGIDRRAIGLEIAEAIHSSLVTHRRYSVTKR